MSYQNESFGMMDAGYFVPRGEIMDWINSLLKINISKIEQLGSGAVYCQLVDVIHPGKVALNKVNWKAKNDYEFINNMKVLQNAFDKIGIKKHVEVEKLAKAKYQDNLEFIQWLKRYYDLNCGERGTDYNAQERRGNGAIDFSFAEKTVIPKTYNGNGVQINNNPVKVEKVEKVQKVEKAKPTTAKVQQNPVKKPEPKPSTKKPDTKQAKIEQSTEYHTDPKLQSQIVKAFQDLEEAHQREHKLQEKLKHAEMKLQMIKEILSTQDDTGMKVTLIEQIYKE